MKLKMITLAAAAVATFSAATALAAPFDIDFENTWDYAAPIGDFYAPSQGVSFTNISGLSNGDGLGFLANGDYYANAPSMQGIAFVSIDPSLSNQAAILSLTSGVQGGLSFYYSSPTARFGAIKALDSTGAVIGTYDFEATDADYSVWRQGTFMFAGTAQSFDFTEAEGAAFDNISTVPEPESFALLLAGLGLVGVAVRRQRKQSV